MSYDNTARLVDLAIILAASAFFCLAYIANARHQRRKERKR